MTPALRPRLALSAVVLAGTSLALAAPAVGSAPPGSQSKPLSAVRQFARDAAARQALAQQDGDEDSGLEPMIRDEQEAAISAAPARAVSAGALSSALRTARGLPAAGGTWRETTAKPFLNDPVPGIGPGGSWNNYGVGFGLVSGRMTALTASGAAVFAGAADGGVWRSTDRGGHWRPWSAGLPRYAIGALATNPADGSVWAGLGEANTNFDAANGLGVWRLAAGASRWSRIGGPEMNSRNAYEIRFVGGHAFAATSTGLYRHAATGGGTWQRVLKPDPNPTHSPYRTSHVTDVVAVPGSAGRTVLANVGWRGGTLPGDTAYNGFYVSAAGGAPGTFRRVAPTGDLKPAEIGRVTFAAAPTGTRLYAVVEDSATVSLLGQGVFVSPTGNPAGPWQRLADPASLHRSGSALDPPDPGKYFPGIQAWYNQYISVDPRDPMHLYLGLEEVFESRDGGRTWFAIGAYWNFDISCATAYYACPPTTHPDQHAVVFAADQVYVGNDGGLWRRARTEHTRAGWINLNRTLHTLQYYSVAIGRDGSAGDVQWGGLQDNGETLNTPRLPVLYQVFTGDGGDTIVDPANGSRAVVEYVYNDMALTTNAGGSYREISPSCQAINPPKFCDPSPLFIAPIETDVRNPDRWVTGGQYVWVNSAAWNTVCSTGTRCDWKPVYRFPAASSLSAVAMTGKTIYAAACQPGPSCNPKTAVPFDRVVVTNAGGRWHDISAGLPRRYVTSLTVDPTDARHVYATVGAYSRRWIPGGGVGHVFESTNAGDSWTDVSGNLPDAPVLKMALWQGRVVVGGDAGVFAASSTAAGAATRWSRLGTGLPPVRHWDLRVGPRGTYLVTATHGRGMWQLGR